MIPFVLGPEDPHTLDHPTWRGRCMIECVEDILFTVDEKPQTPGSRLVSGRPVTITAGCSVRLRGPPAPLHRFAEDRAAGSLTIVPLAGGLNCDAAGGFARTTPVHRILVGGFFCVD